MVFAQELHLRNYNYWIIGLTKLLFFRWLKCLNYSIFVSNSDTTADNLRNEPSEVNRDIYEKFRFENQFESSLIRFRPLEYGPLLCFSLNQSHPDRLKEWKSSKLFETGEVNIREMRIGTHIRYEIKVHQFIRTMIKY